ncbi:MAG: SIS domain-containing protein [Sciscionella sp.]
MSAEIAQQPDVLAGLLADRSQIAQVARHIGARQPRFALLAARGSSDHAALYAKYLVEILLQIPAGLLSPSTTTLYGARPDLSDVLLISVSQSGGSPDLVEATALARERGAMTVAVSNTPGSELSATTEFAVDIGAGDELAVAATKTYTATLMALYLLVDAIRGGDGTTAAGTPQAAAATLESSIAAVGEAVTRYRFAERVLACGRGFSSASAAEAALKLAETSYLAARSYSGADLLHGPVASVDAETAVLAMTSKGKGGEAMREVLATVAESGADVLAIGSAAADMPAALRIPTAAVPEELAPIVEILPAQRLALRLALARGVDPDQPRGLHKVTRTR